MKKIELFAQKYVGVIFILFILNGIALSYFSAELKVYTDLPKLDFMLGGYTQETIIELIGAYGDEGLELYYWLTILDMPFPFLVFGFALGYGVYKLKKWEYPWLETLIKISAYAFLVFDLVENFTVFFLYGSGFEWVNQTWIMISSLATQIKLIALLVIYISTLLLWIVTLLQTIKKK